MAMSMFRSKQRPEPLERPFVHADGCKILKNDPGVELEWSQVERGHFERICVCGRQDYYVPAAPRTQLDPLDPATGHHLGGCEFATATDPALLKVLLKVTEKDGGYWWVQCGSCAAGWQVPHYAESVG
jgi:hypothetical protein